MQGTPGISSSYSLAHRQQKQHGHPLISVANTLVGHRGGWRCSTLASLRHLQGKHSCGGIRVFFCVKGGGDASKSECGECFSLFPNTTPLGTVDLYW